MSRFDATDTLRTTLLLVAIVSIGAGTATLASHKWGDDHRPSSPEHSSPTGSPVHVKLVATANDALKSPLFAALESATVRGPSILVRPMVPTAPIESHAISVPWYHPTEPEDVIKYAHAKLGFREPWVDSFAKRTWASDLYLMKHGHEGPARFATPHTGTIMWIVGFRTASVQPESLLAAADRYPLPDHFNPISFTEAAVYVRLDGTIRTEFIMNRLNEEGEMHRVFPWTIEMIADLPEAPALRSIP